MDSFSYRCFVPGCKNSEGNTTNATFYQFPHDFKEEWLIAIGRSRDTFILDELVCSEHFQTTDFDDCKKLLPNVVPILNIPVEPEEIHTEIKLQFNNDTGSCREFEDEEYDCCEEKTNHEALLCPEEPQEYPFELRLEQEVNECDSSDEYHLEYEDLPNCRTCLEEIGPEGGYYIAEEHGNNEPLKEMIIFCVPQMASTLEDTDMVCKNCYESIKFCFNFVENCLKVEAELLEKQEDHISIIVDENNEENNEQYHISLDHDYIPNITTEPEVGESPNDKLGVLKYPSDTKSVCSKCNKKFKTENYMLDHIRKMHHNEVKDPKRKKKSSVFDCGFCEKSFMTRLGFDLHLQLSHRDEVEKRREVGEYTCKTCGRRFMSLGSLSEHNSEEHNFACSICSQRFNSKSELETHSDIHPNDHLCHVCGKGFKKRSNLKIHITTHNDPNTHLCHRCGQGFKSQLSLSLHLKHHNPNLKFQCNLCPSTFQQKYRLELHKKVRHLGIREYKCNICEKKFCYKSNLKSHYRLKHSEVRPYECKQCGARFARSDYLKRHTTCNSESKKRRGFLSHKKRKYVCLEDYSVPITCKLCNKVFKDIQMLRLHVKTHTKLRKYKCNFCNLTFTTSSNRDRHAKVHEVSSKLFRCEVCFKKMETQEALEEHLMMSHENSKRYKCHGCDELFSRKYLLHSHVAEKHANAEEFEKEKEVLYKVVLQDYLIVD